MATLIVTLFALGLIVVPRLICFISRRPGRGAGYRLLQFTGWLLLFIAILLQAGAYGYGLISFFVL
ncbi:MAG: hypothetical protein K8R36_11445, partial [Planctomycetales bacterium]|nr:hypothetical protein [Planctomycetales bacterium]